MLLVKERLGKRPMETNQTLDNLIKENIDIRKIMANANIIESLDLLINNYKKYHGKLGLGYENKNHKEVKIYYLVSSFKLFTKTSSDGVLRRELLKNTNRK